MAQARSEMPLPRKNRPKRSPTRSVTLLKQPESAFSYICYPPLSNVLQEPLRKMLCIFLGEAAQTRALQLRLTLDCFALLAMTAKLRILGLIHMILGAALAVSKEFEFVVPGCTPRTLIFSTGKRTDS